MACLLIYLLTFVTRVVEPRPTLACGGSLSSNHLQHKLRRLCQLSEEHAATPRRICVFRRVWSLQGVELFNFFRGFWVTFQAFHSNIASASEIYIKIMFASFEEKHR